MHCVNDFRRHSGFHRLFAVLMAAFLINCSIDPPDAAKQGIAWGETQGINIQESFVELLVEKVLGFENAIAEYEDSDTPESPVKKSISLDIFILPAPAGSLALFEVTARQSASITIGSFAGACRDIHSPPPEA